MVLVGTVWGGGTPSVRESPQVDTILLGNSDLEIRDIKHERGLTRLSSGRGTGDWGQSH